MRVKKSYFSSVVEQPLLKKTATTLVSVPVTHPFRVNVLLETGLRVCKQSKIEKFRTDFLELIFKHIFVGEIFGAAVVQRQHQTVLSVKV